MGLPGTVTTTPIMLINVSMYNLNVWHRSCAYILAIVHRGASYSPTGLSLISFLDFCDDHLSIQITDRHGTAMYYINADMIMIVTNIIVTLHLSVDGFTQQME